MRLYYVKVQAQMKSSEIIGIIVALAQFNAILGAASSLLKWENNVGLGKNITKKKCKVRDSKICKDLQICPESNFQLEFLDYNVSGNCGEQRRIVIRGGEKRGLECLEYEEVHGEVVSLGGRCYFRNGRRFYSPPDYCLMSSTEAIICMGTFLLPKCCGVKEAYSDISGRCQPTSKSYLAQIGDGRSKTMETGSRYLSFIIQPFHLVFPRNVSSFAGHAKFYLQESGVSFSPLTGVFLRGEFNNLNGNYCVEQAFASYSGSWNDPIRLFYDSSLEVEAKKYAFIVGMIWLGSIPFDLITAFLHIFVLYRSVHGALLASYLIAGASVRLMGALIQFSFYSEISNRQCTFLDVFQKLMYINTLSWMTLLNFNMWIAFRKLHHKEGKRHGLCCAYLSYFAFATIFPCIVVLVTWKIGEFYRTAESPACVLYGLISLLTFSAPIVVFIIINFFLFLRTSLNIKGYQKSTEEILKDSQSVNRKTYGLFAKLFLMTGPIWVVRLVLLFSHLKSWYLSIGGAILESIFVAPEIIFFFLIMADQDTWKYLRRKFCKREDSDESSNPRDSQRRHLSLQRNYSSIPRTATSSCVTTPGSVSQEITERY